jgi:hypothetical protein
VATQGDSGRAEKNSHDGWIASAVLRFDWLLRCWHRVFEYSNDPLCVFRAQVARADRSVFLRDGTAISVGDPIIEIHLWNEHVPAMPLSGATMRWGRSLGHGMQYSLQLLSDHLSRHPEYSDIVAIRANLMVATERNTDQMTRIMCHLGFDLVPADDRLDWFERLHRFVDNVLGYLLCIAVNPASARAEVMHRVRSTMMLSRRVLDQSHGTAARNSPVQPRQVHGFSGSSAGDPAHAGAH